MIILEPFNVELVGTSTEPVTLAEFKTHARITFNDDDSYISTLIPLARATLEQMTGQALIAGDYIAHYSGLGCFCRLPYMAQSEVKINGVLIHPIFRGDCSVFPHPGIQDFSVTYKAGKCSPVAKMALLLLITHLYENRSATANVKVEEMPLSFKCIIEKMRVKNF